MLERCQDKSIPMIWYSCGDPIVEWNMYLQRDSSSAKESCGKASWQVAVLNAKLHGTPYGCSPDGYSSFPIHFVHDEWHMYQINCTPVGYRGLWPETERRWQSSLPNIQNIPRKELTPEQFISSFKKSYPAYADHVEKFARPSSGLKLGLPGEGLKTAHLPMDAVRDIVEQQTGYRARPSSGVADSIVQALQMQLSDPGRIKNAQIGPYYMSRPRAGKTLVQKAVVDAARKQGMRVIELGPTGQAPSSSDVEQTSPRARYESDSEDGH